MAQDAKGKEVGVAGRGETARGQEQVSLLFDKLLNFVCNRSEIYSIHNFYLTTIQTCWLTILYKNINDAKKTLKKNEKWCSNARTFSSNFWVLWQPPIGNVTPYFRGLVPYDQGEIDRYHRFLYLHYTLLLPFSLVLPPLIPPYFPVHTYVVLKYTVHVHS